MKAIGYVRVSTDGQVQDGVSLEAQRAKVEAWCTANGCALLQVHVDAGLSGSRADNRPALQAALKQACEGKAVLVVYSLSRLARSTKDAIVISERLAKAGADLVSLSERIDTTSAAGKMIFRMLAVLAEFERDQIAERTRGALLHLKSQNKRISGQIPFGFDLAENGTTLIPNPAELEAIERMTALRAEGVSLRRIAQVLTAQGVPTKTGAAWSGQAVHRILARRAA